MWNEAYAAKQSTWLFPEIVVGSRKHDGAIYVPLWSPNAKTHEGASRAFHEEWTRRTTSSDIPGALQLQQLHEGNTASHACPDNVAFYCTLGTKRIKEKQNLDYPLSPAWWNCPTRSNLPKQ